MMKARQGKSVLSERPLNMADKLPNGNDEKGFSAFSGLVSDVDKLLCDVNADTPPKKQPSTQRPTSQNKEPAGGQGVDWSNTRNAVPRVESGQLNKGNGKSVIFLKLSLHVLRNWVLYGIGVLVLIGWLNNKPHAAATSSRPFGKIHTSESVSASNRRPIDGDNKFDIERARNAGHSNAEIADYLAKQYGYDIGSARKAGYSDEQIIAHLSKTKKLDTSEPSDANTPKSNLTPLDYKTFDPNGRSWPRTAGYINGFKKLHTGGLSSVTVDNGQNVSPVFVKLFFLDSSKPKKVRVFYIPAYGSFTLSNVTAGNYDIRYQDLVSGDLSKSESFNLHETPTDDGVQYSRLTMTLYKVRNGNMQTYSIPDSEF